MTEPKQYIVLDVGKMFPSKKTNGDCCTIVFRERNSQQTWKTWPDTTFKSWNWWKNVKKGDIVTNVGVWNESRKLLSATSEVKVLGNVNDNQEELIKE